LKLQIAAASPAVVTAQSTRNDRYSLESLWPVQANLGSPTPQQQQQQQQKQHLAETIHLLLSAGGSMLHFQRLSSPASASF
jgi:hypothetical protein